MVAFVQKNNFTTNVTAFKILGETYVDFDSYIDYIIMETFGTELISLLVL